MCAVKPIGTGPFVFSYELSAASIIGVGSDSRTTTVLASGNPVPLSDVKRPTALPTVKAETRGYEYFAPM